MGYFAALIAAVSCLIGGVRRDESTEAVKKQIEAMYARRAEAALNHDVRGVLDVLAPGFSFHYVQGQIAHRKEWEDGLRARMEQTAEEGRRAARSGGTWKNPERVSTVIQSISVMGDRATVTAVTTTRNSAAYPQGLSYRATLEETSRDTWLRTALGWRLLTIEQTRNRTMTDESRAKPMPAKK